VKPDQIDALSADLRLVIGRLVRQARHTDDLPLPQAAVLGYLDREGAMTTSDLAAAAHVRPQSMAHTVRQLLEASYIEAGPHPTDGRKSLLRLTASGRRVLDRRRQRRADWLASAIARLPAADQRTLAAAVPILGQLDAVAER